MTLIHIGLTLVVMYLITYMPVTPARQGTLLGYVEGLCLLVMVAIGFVVVVIAALPFVLYSLVNVNKELS